MVAMLASSSQALARLCDPRGECGVLGALGGEFRGGRAQGGHGRVQVVRHLGGETHPGLGDHRGLDALLGVVPA